MNSVIMVNSCLIEVKPKNLGASLRKAAAKGDAVIVRRVTSRKHNLAARTGCICMVCGRRNTYDDSECNMGHDAWLEPYDVRKNTLWYRQMLANTGLSSDEFNKLFWDNSIKSIHLLTSRYELED